MEVSSWKINCFCGRLSSKPCVIIGGTKSGETHGTQPFFSWETVTDAPYLKTQEFGWAKPCQNGSIPGIPWAISYICILSHGKKNMLEKFATSRSRSLRVHCHEPKLLVNQPPCHDPSADSVVIDWLRTLFVVA